MKTLLTILCGAVVAGAGAAEPSGNPPATVCVPERVVTKTPCIVYDCKQMEYCLPRCRLPFFFWWRKKCEDGLDCRQPRVRNVLIKKVVVEEIESCKCVPKAVPSMPPVGQQP